MPIPSTFVESQLNSHAFLCSYLLQLIVFCAIHNSFDFVASVMETGSEKFLHAKTEVLINVLIEITYTEDACKPFSTRTAVKLVGLQRGRVSLEVEHSLC